MFNGLALGALVLAVALPLLIDMFAAVRAHRYRNYAFKGENTCDTFNVLVPIYGSMHYLENVAFLQAYGSRVILCTTSGESSEFYDELDALSNQHGFRVYYSPMVVAQSKRRSTKAPIRDRVIRDALREVVDQPYVVCIDADTTTPRSLNELIGELQRSEADIASVRLVPQDERSMLVKLQQFEYRLAMRLRFIMPWLVSGACHAARADALRDIMDGHSLFFQGNDVEVGLRAVRLGHKVIHIPFEVTTNVPSDFMSWWRQRIAWAGGEVRLFIANIRFILHHPFFWLYGGGVVIALAWARWYAVIHPGWGLLAAFVAYYVAVCAIHWRHRNAWLLLMPLYTLFYSLVIVPIGLVTYVTMSVSGRNAGIISTKRMVEVSE